MLLLGAVVAMVTRWHWAVVFGAFAWPVVLVFVPDVGWRTLLIGVALGAVNAAVGGVWGSALRRLATRLTPAH